MYQNVAFSILVISTKTRYSSFSKKAFVFQKICFEVKVGETFEISTDVTQNMPIPQTEGYSEKSLLPFVCNV